MKNKFTIPTDKVLNEVEAWQLIGKAFRAYAKEEIRELHPFDIRFANYTREECFVHEGLCHAIFILNEIPTTTTRENLISFRTYQIMMHRVIAYKDKKKLPPFIWPPDKMYAINRARLASYFVKAARSSQP